MEGLKQRQKKLDLQKNDEQEINPKTKQLEFFGVPGVCIVMIGMSAVVLLQYFACNEQTGCSLSNAGMIVEIAKKTKLLDPLVFFVYVSWYLWLFLLYLIIPGESVNGTQLRTGEHLKYPINGKRSL
ncbi:hypothetical protein BB559_005523 [Furculomyces boomerangus]|uniref:Uncharacterized protein n=2 Tax=Harpellales TaxID=61421 RepID=A0A2T9Y8E2_9FUNG|nr:hypothetical protein BB559_005523 [Furculomyces boomerangus]PVZ97557.1 hypothetical protein BB558_006489 [Smittium angustum]